MYRSRVEFIWVSLRSKKEISSWAEQLGWGPVYFQSPAESKGQTGAQNEIAFQLVLTIAGQKYRLLVMHRENEEIEHPEEITVRFQLRNLAPGGLIPGGFKLRLLTEDGEPFEDNEDIAKTAVEELYIDAILKPGDGIIWETEPIPENYRRQILVDF